MIWKRLSTSISYKGKTLQICSSKSLKLAKEAANTPGMLHTKDNLTWLKIRVQCTSKKEAVWRLMMRTTLWMKTIMMQRERAVFFCLKVLRLIEMPSPKNLTNLEHRLRRKARTQEMNLWFKGRAWVKWCTLVSQISEVATTNPTLCNLR